jgi:PTH1 family peptidyl-tRNA hydrolase
MVVDSLAGRLGFPVNDKKHQCLLGQGHLAGTRIMLAKPQTYMNRSGQAVLEILHYYHDRIDDFIVVHDDLDLDFGRIRFKSDGGAAGHKGLLSIAGLLNSTDFQRLKVGIGRPPGRLPVESFVLSEFSPGERKTLPALIEACLDGLETWAREGIEKAMNDFNGLNLREKETENEAR